MSSAATPKLNDWPNARIILGLLVLFIASCGGGGGGGGDSGSVAAPAPAPTEPAPEPQSLSIIDALPNDAMTNTHPGHNRVSFAHLAQSDLSIDITSDCSGTGTLASTTIRRDLFDLANTDFDQVLDHKVRCTLAPATAYSLLAEGTRPNDATFNASYSFSTGAESTPGLIVNDQQSFTRDTVDELFTGYVAGALVNDLDLPSSVEALIFGTILELAEANWDNLVNPDARFDVVAESVSYLSRQPDGAPSSMLTGLVVRPDLTTANRFVARNSVIVLTHATGSTPSELDPADAWYILANQFAARGYLVIAADNYGRGGTGDMPETYLLANITADNTIDLIDQVLEETRYEGVFDGSNITIVGYSQGGHSAFGLWLALTTQGNSQLSVDRVYAGGAPHNLYQTFRGVLQNLNGTCSDSDYCRFVDDETTVPFATDRILPGLLQYTDAGIALSDIVSDGNIDAGFVSDFLNGASELDALKVLLQLNSFSDIDFTNTALADSQTVIHLYHSDFDRLVPKANTNDLASSIGTHLTVDFHENRCNADGYEVISKLTDKVGVLHTLCGLAVLDDVMEDLR